MDLDIRKQAKKKKIKKKKEKQNKDVPRADRDILQPTAEQPIEA